VVQKLEIQGGVLLQESLTWVVDDHILISILNTNDTEAEVEEPLVKIEEIDFTQRVAHPT
jgi:hypothetical protein